MVLPPPHVRLAARHGDCDTVAAWLDSDSGGSVNDVATNASGRTLLLLATLGPRPPVGSGWAGHVDEEHVALARYLVERGADVNVSSNSGSTPLHYAARGRSESGPAMVALLLKAGANGLVTNLRGENPLTLTLKELAMKGPSRPRMEIAVILLRALSSLDHAHTGTDVYSAEQVLDTAIARADPPPPSDNCFRALRTVVAGVRAAGGWRAYDRKPRAEILRLRSLAQRRRAVFLASTTRRYDYPYIRSLNFLVQCPPEIAWLILGYWRCQYPSSATGTSAGDRMIDMLGFR